MNHSPKSWVEIAGLEDADPFVRYLSAMYWSVGTLCGGGLPSLLGSPIPGACGSGSVGVTRRAANECVTRRDAWPWL